MADGKNGDVLTVFQLSALANKNFFKGRSPFGHYTLAPRIADHERPLHSIQLSGIHEVAQFAFVHGSADNQVGNTTHEGNIVSAVVGRAIFTNQSGPVEHHYYRQFLNGYIMYYLV